jgi:hypothetical protein
MRTGRPKAPLVLTEAEREGLESLATRRVIPNLPNPIRLPPFALPGVRGPALSRLSPLPRPP